MGIAAGVAAAGVAASVGTSLASSSAQSSAANNASNLQQSQQSQTAANLAPYNETGQGALPQLSNLNGQYSNPNTSAYTSSLYPIQQQEATQTNSTGAYGGAYNALDQSNSALNNYVTPNLAGAATDLQGQNVALQGQGVENAAANQQIGQSEGYIGQAGGIANTLANGINEQTLENTPGYQFTLQQGLESTQNSAAARGLANSGAALKGAASYATGLADQTYQSQYNNLLSTANLDQSLSTGSLNNAGALVNTGNAYGNEATGYGTAATGYQNQAAAGSNLATSYNNLATGYDNLGSGLTNNAQGYGNVATSYLNANTAQQGNVQNAYNRLMGTASLGENAAAQTGVTGQQAANAAGNYGTQAGIAQSAGITGVGNAIQGIPQSYQMYNNLLNGNSTSGTGSSSYYDPTQSFSG